MDNPSEQVLSVLKRLEGCVTGGHGIDKVSMCIDMMQTELDRALDAHPDMDTSACDAIIDHAIDVYHQMLAGQ